MLGLELYEPIEIGPLVVESLGVSLPELRFPVDLSGGVRVFRHRRGRLEQMRLALSLDGLGRWMTRRLKDCLGGLVQPVLAYAREQAIGIGLVGASGAVAFDLLWAPAEGEARFVVSRARGAGVSGAGLTVALAAVDTAFAGFARRHGRVVTVERAGLRVARAVMPAIGARAPSDGRMRLSALEVAGDRVSCELDATFPAAELSTSAIRALELAVLTTEADEALVAGRLDDARAGYVAALERAPRHAELARTIAELDARAADRAEAALSLLLETLPVDSVGAVGAELLARVGDVETARTVLRHFAAAEEVPPVAALWWERLAMLETDPVARRSALDEAVGRAPGLASVRWARLEARLLGGDVEGALSDAQHLEASTRGNRARHDVISAAARRVLVAGFVREAGRLYERALRYVPDDAEATAGLARSLLELGRTRRAVTLLERAIALGDRAGTALPEAELDLAKILATELGDRPQAIARARRVPATASCALEARALEGAWRAAIGDLVGSSQAYGRMREAVELAQGVDSRQARDFLLEAAAFEREVTRDWRAVERHLAVALRVVPQDERVQKLYREAAAAVLARHRGGDVDSSG